MGKKSRKKEGAPNAAAKKASSPRGLDPLGLLQPTIPVDLTKVDSTICAHCKEMLPTMTWREEEAYMLTCCGAHLCRKCAPDFGFNFVAPVDDISPNEASSAEELMPDLICGNVHKPCPTCNSHGTSQEKMMRSLLHCTDAG